MTQLSLVLLKVVPVAAAVFTIGGWIAGLETDPGVVGYLWGFSACLTAGYTLSDVLGPK